MSHKYDLVTVPTRTDRKVKYQPWYRERLELKYLRSHQKAAAFNSRRWVFVRNDMDDMRKGKPHSMKGEEMVVKGREDVVPVVDSTMDILKGKGSPSTAHHIEKIIRKANRKSTTLYSKIGPRRQIQARQLNSFVEDLQCHPLAMYPHYSESVPPELFDKIVDQVDPMLRPSASNADLDEGCDLLTVLEEGGQQHDLDEDRCVPSEQSEVDDGGESRKQDEAEDGGNREVYRMPLKKSDKEMEEEEEEERTRRKIVSASQENRVKDVTKDLCQWMAELNTEDSSNCLDETTINSLFTSDPESMADVLPFHVIEVGNIPASLREAFQSRNSSATSSSRYAVVDVPRTYSGLVKTKYGAWYLPPRTWKRMHVDEPLRDPKVISREMEKERAKTNVSLDEAIVSSHGAKAFKNYILSEKPEANMPYFLNDVQRYPTKNK